MYVVKGEYRGAGIGKQIWNAAIEHLGYRNKGLSAVAQLFPVYRDKAGFNHVADWTVDLYKLESPWMLCKNLTKKPNNILARQAAPYVPNHLCPTYPRITNPVQMPDIINQNESTNRYHSNQLIDGLKTVPLTRILLPHVIRFDSTLHSYDRSKIVALALKENGARTRVALQGDKVLGYGCLKPNLQGLWMVTPLYAQNELVARRILIDLLKSLDEEELISGVVLKSPSDNPSAVSLLKSLGFQRQTYSLKRCYTQEVFEIHTKYIFAFHTSVFCSE